MLPEQKRQEEHRQKCAYVTMSRRPKLCPTSGRGCNLAHILDLVSNLLACSSPPHDQDS